MASDENNRVCIITGANSGIGYEAAKLICEKGYEVILACRNEQRGMKAVTQIKELMPGAKVEYMELDLNSLTSVRKFVDNFHATGKPLHILCNNAGVFVGKDGYQVTEDGFEMTFGVNHLGHFLLTHLLMEDLKKTASDCGEARIVVTSSSIHNPETGGVKGPHAHIEFDDLMQSKATQFHAFLAYKNSKLANILFTYELHKRIVGSGVMVNCLCPGFIPTTGIANSASFWTRWFLYLVTPLLKWKGVTRTVQEGGTIISNIATDPSLNGVSGKFFQFGIERQSSQESYDETVASRLWDVSEELVKLEDNFKITKQ